MKKLLAGAVVFISVVPFLASAQPDSHLDVVAAKDQALYNTLGLSEHFGVQFHPHTKVCADAAQGDAACDARVVTDNAGKPLTRNNFNVQPLGYGPAQLTRGYNISPTATNKKIIAVVDAYDDPYAASDLSTYSSMYGIVKLPTCSGTIAASAVPCFQKVNQTGNTFSYPYPNQGWALEESLDIEAAHAVCQNCSILLVEAGSASYTNLMAGVDEAVKLGANVVSNSYGSSEFLGENAYDSHFNHPGVAITVSAGDSGYGVEYPAASPYVTAVGGTTLLLNSDGSYNHELAWSGTGSGCSAYEAKPANQTDTGCSGRTVADVSADADPNTGAAVYDSYGYGGTRGWFEVGGTSLASPIIAAVYALSGNIPAATQENSLPYSHTASLHDVISGSNGSCSVGYLCTALAGYDGPTGLGTPNGVSAF